MEQVGALKNESLNMNTLEGEFGGSYRVSGGGVDLDLAMMSQRKYVRSVTSFPRISLDEVMVSRGEMVILYNSTHLRECVNTATPFQFSDVFYRP